MIWAITILSCLILITYIVYPLSVFFFLQFQSKNKAIIVPESNSRVFLIMSVHNEEKVIQQKLDSIFQSNFDHSRLICYIGSDCSKDNTNAVIDKFKEEFIIRFVKFEQRTGKPVVINQLVETINKEYLLNDKDLFLITDANVIFHPDFIRNLSSSFNDRKLGLVDGRVINSKSTAYTSESERVYVELETKIKKAEGDLWGYSMGPFGGAYMIKANLFRAVPPNFLVDDFFIFFNIIQEGYLAKVNPSAICYEEVAGSLKEEFRRKIRISAGNFQNAFYFLPDYIQLWKPKNIIFVLHKFLRWITPLLTIIIGALLAYFGITQPIAHLILLIMISLLVGLPIVNFLLNQVNLNFKPIQGVAYLILMNLALFIGFLKFLKGIKSNVWEPTKRKVSS